MNDSPTIQVIIRTPVKTVALLVLSTAALSACTTLQNFLAPLGFDDPVAEQPLQPEPEQRPRLDPISRNYFRLASPEQSVIGEPQMVFTKAEHTFSMLAREYGLGYDELVAANPGIDPWLPGEGTPVLLPTQFVLPDVPREGLVLNIASKRLFYFLPAEEGQPQTVMTFPIGIGRVGWETPLGSSAVVAKATDPHWYVPASVRREHAELGNPLPAVVPPGPDNPLGTRVLQLDLPGYLIHGTNQPYGVGMRVSHGCVRLYPENIELLYELVGIGEPVTIINQPYLAGWLDGELYLETHAPLEDDAITADEHLANIFEFVDKISGNGLASTSREHARRISEDALGIPVVVAGSESIEILDRVRVVRNTVEPDPNMPTLAEVRAILDAPPEEEQASGQSAADE